MPHFANRRAFFFVSLFLCLAIRPASSAASDMPGINVDGGDALWDGSEYMDSLYATGAHLLHAIGITGYGVSAAVLDTPYDVTHEAIRDNIIAEASAGFSWDGDGFYPYTETMTSTSYSPFDQAVWEQGLNGVAVPGLTEESRAEYGVQDLEYYKQRFSETSHGTHVSGTVIAMAPDAGLVLVTAPAWRESDPASRTSDLLAEFLLTDAALNYVSDIAGQYNIVAMNNSWGNSTFINYGNIDADSQEILQNLYDAGVGVYFSSGNQGMNAPSPPANYSYVHPVGALMPSGLIGVFSNQPLSDNPQQSVFVVAPGVDINSSVPYGEYSMMTGTSMASPHVTGAHTLLASGARNASTEEIFQAIFDSADIFLYDGDLMLAREETHMDNVDDLYWDAFALLDQNPEVELNVEDAGNKDLVRRQDDWRELMRLRTLARYLVNSHDLKTASELSEKMAELLVNDEELNIYFPYFGALGQVEYRFLRVDKAYMNLTESRMNTRADETAGINSAAPEMLRAFGMELTSGLSEETSQIFQRLDAQSAGVLADVGRQMSPQWNASTLEFLQIRTADHLRTFGRRGDRRRLENRYNVFGKPISSADALSCPTSCPPSIDGVTIWVEGFGSLIDRSGAREHSDYDGHFAGTTLAFEKSWSDAAFGLFASWADFRINGGDGLAKGNWYTGGIYGQIERNGFFLDAAAGYNYADYKSQRSIFIPGAVFTTPYAGEYINLSPFDLSARSDNRQHGAAFRLGGGYDHDAGNGWTFGPRVEGSLAYGRMSGFGDSGAGVLGLRVNAFSQIYAEGGAGGEVARCFALRDGQRLIAAVKVMGMYGRASGDNLKGRTGYGNGTFSIDPKRYRGFWALPEASLTWRVNDRVDLSATYAGRFGNRYIENAGYLRIGIGF